MYRQVSPTYSAPITLSSHHCRRRATTCSTSRSARAWVLVTIFGCLRSLPSLWIVLRIINHKKKLMLLHKGSVFVKHKTQGNKRQKNTQMQITQIHKAHNKHRSTHTKHTQKTQNAHTSVNTHTKHTQNTQSTQTPTHSNTTHTN